MLKLAPIKLQLKNFHGIKLVNLTTKKISTRFFKNKLKVETCQS